MELRNISDGNRTEVQDEWSERCQHWEQASKAEKPARKRREKQSTALIITGYGFVISVDKKRLIIRGGITHYPQKVSEQVFYKGSLDLPPRIVIVDGKGTISVDALDWIAEQGIALIRIKYDGTSAIIMSPNGFAADPDKVAWQYATRSDPVNAMLNYAYAALLTKMKIQAICDGYDPMIGILHDQRHKEKEITASFALDLMEPHRPVVDRGILKLVAEHTFSGADFDLQSDGVVRVNPSLICRIVRTFGNAV